MNMSPEELLALKQELAYVPNLDGARLEMAVANFDPNVAREEIAEHVVGEIWDRETSINGVSAEDVIEIHEVSETGSVFIVREGDRVIQFQPYDPDEPGNVEMNSSRATDSANEAVQEYIEDRVNSTLRERIIAEAAS